VSNDWPNSNTNGAVDSVAISFEWKASLSGAKRRIVRFSSFAKGDDEDDDGDSGMPNIALWETDGDEQAGKVSSGPVNGMSLRGLATATKRWVAS